MKESPWRILKTKVPGLELHDSHIEDRVMEGTARETGYKFDNLYCI
jgi:hypothetical protein